MTLPISRLPVPTLDSLPDDLHQRVLDVQEKLAGDNYLERSATTIVSG
jgi:hypothetical protein